MQRTGWTFHPKLIKVAKLSGITNMAINALEITRLRIKIFVVLFLKCLFLQMTYTTEKFKKIEEAITKTRRTSCTISKAGEVTSPSSLLWSVVFITETESNFR